MKALTLGNTLGESDYSQKANYKVIVKNQKWQRGRESPYIVVSPLKGKRVELAGVYFG